MAFETNYDEADEQDLKPKGEYECVIKNAHETVTRKGTPYIAVDCSIRDDVENPCGGMILHSLWMRKRENMTKADEACGGVLEEKDRIAQGRGQNSYTAWNEAGKLQNQLIDTILAVNCHTICTMRSKMDYAMQENERGGFSPVKVGLAPVQRDSTEYEFDIVLDIARNHIATASKDVTFLDKYREIITPQLGRDLAAWLNDGAEPPKPPLCEICGKPIQPEDKLSAQDIVTASREGIGKRACMKCFKMEYAKAVTQGEEAARAAEQTEA